jgi:hypothetical protein
MGLNATSGICGIEGSIGRAFSPRACGAAAHGASPHAGIGRAVGANAAWLTAVYGATPHAGIGRAVGAGAAWAVSVHGAAPHAGIGRAVGAKTAMSFRCCAQSCLPVELGGSCRREDCGLISTAIRPRGRRLGGQRRGGGPSRGGRSRGRSWGRRRLPSRPGSR